MRCADCGYRQRTSIRLGDRVWIRYRGEYVPGVVCASQGPSPEYADVYLVVRWRGEGGATIRSLLPHEDKLAVIRRGRGDASPPPCPAPCPASVAAPAGDLVAAL